MTRHDDILERLATADPAPDDSPPGADQERAAERVLERVLAQPRTEPASAGRGRRRRPRLALAAAAVGVAALAAVVAFALPGGGASIDPAAEAYAAVTEDGGVLHTVSTITERPEGGAPTRAILESWLAADGSRRRTLQYDVRAGSARGRLVAEGVDRPRKKLGVIYAGPRDDGPIYSGRAAGTPGERYDPLSDYRSMYRSGRVRSEGRAEVDGRDVWRLAVSVRRSSARNVFEVDGRRRVFRVPAHTNRYVYFVDARTYLPVLVQEDTVAETVTGRGFQRSQTSERFTTFERLTGSAAERPLEPSERFRKRYPADPEAG